MANAASSPPPPTPSHILETILYVRSMDASREFYGNILNLKHDLSTPDLTTYPLGQTTLLLFKLGGAHTTDRYPSTERPKDVVPKHGPSSAILDLLTSAENGDSSQAGRSLGQHFALAVDSVADVERWERHFEAVNKEQARVKVLGSMCWPRGGKSLYFEDCDGHVGEIGSRGIWKHY
ncbi:hypothetical protein LTR70_009523 [Exophiala xenobiotica]|uniref:VOC domain-containing protein n=1 Tax=Lithohypha guttulata TaxID=1690604 RepID=A0ABR0K077_9EURO|nr:hypothetical protein LTR24_008368 [Lithohypha guttulata]KAK5310380.1 hypothetical protein LTR70_009523 [Exophiala xenobiotica]